jgi:hypothetical protein
MGVQWKVTDFVTLGSPLAHAPFLLASDKDDFARRVAEREYPSCPPQENDARDKQYGASLLKATTGGDLLHHAALFACTRWTNLYFDRDIIGGRISILATGSITSGSSRAACSRTQGTGRGGQSRPARSGARSQGVVDRGTEPSRRNHRATPRV